MLDHPIPPHHPAPPPADAWESPAKQERNTTIAERGIPGTPDTQLVKRYTPSLRALPRGFLRRSRAHREFRNLTVLRQRGVPAVEPVYWDERRVLGCERWSELATIVIRGPALSQVLDRLPIGGPRRRRLCTEAGRLLCHCHAAGLAWLSAMPRNLIVAGGDRLVICDVPYLLDLGRDIALSRAALVDLFTLAGSPARRRQLSERERRTMLLSYCGGDRGSCRRVLAELARRSPLRQKLERYLWTGLRVLPRCLLHLFTRRGPSGVRTS